MKKMLLFFVLLIVSSSILQGQETEYWFFRESGILKPFISEIRSTVIKTEFAYLNKLDDNYYVKDYTGRPFVEVHLGTELPCFYFVNHREKMKFSVSGYFGNILLIDMFEKITSPVINTDYFFGLQTAVLKYTDHKYFRNLGLKLVPVFHESTHIGDEFSIHGYQDIPDFRRVNVSYEAWEIAGVINDPDTIRTNLFSLKAGFHGLWKDARGYSTVDSLETKGVRSSPSEKNYEFYLQMNFQRTNGFLCSGRWMNILSVEMNNRLRYSYDVDIPGERTWNFNMYLGWKYLLREEKKNVGFFLRYYNGIVPNGQFRNTGGYRYAALSIVYN